MGENDSVESIISEIRSQLDNLLMEAGQLVEFDVVLKTGKVLMAIRKALMTFMGWTEIPSTAVQQIPVIELNRLQLRFVSASKHGTLVKLIQAFHSACLDVKGIFVEILFVEPGEISKWKEREKELIDVLKGIHNVLSDHLGVLGNSLAKENEYAQILEIEQDLAVILEILNKVKDAVSEDRLQHKEEVLKVIAKSKLILEKDDEDAVAEAEKTMQVGNGIDDIEQLQTKFNAIADLVKSWNGTGAKSFLMVAVKFKKILGLLQQLTIEN